VKKQRSDGGVVIPVIEPDRLKDATFPAPCAATTLFFTAEAM
jgi:hypothetical protein